MGRKWNAKSDRARNKQRARRTLRRKAAAAPRYSEIKHGTDRDNNQPGNRTDPDRAVTP